MAKTKQGDLTDQANTPEQPQQKSEQQTGQQQEQPKDAAKEPKTQEQIEKALSKIDHSKYTDYPNLNGEKLSIWKNTVFKDATALELYYFANVAHAAQLNPDLHEVWAWKDKYGKINIMVAEAGYRRNAERHPDYEGVDFGVIFEGDTFSVDFIGKTIIHNREGIQKNRPIGAWAIAKRKNHDPIYTVVSMSEYQKDKDVWKNNPSDMIAKVARTKALSVQFPISGTIPEHEVVMRDGSPEFREHHAGEESPEQIAAEELNNKIAEALEVHQLYQGEDKDEIANEIRAMQHKKTLTVEKLDSYIQRMSK